MYAIFFAAGLAVVVMAGMLQKAPGYMDADYYYATARGIAEGQGFGQMFVWNYLDMPVDLPQPSHTYWMPLVSLLTAGGIKMGGGWWTARLPLWLISALIPTITIWLARKLGGAYRETVLAGVFALLPGFYLAYLPTTDAFGLYMILGTLALIVGCGEGHIGQRIFGFGILSGMLHMTRADGILWVMGGVILVGRHCWSKKIGWLETMGLMGLCIAGYAIPTAGWYLRNWNVWGSLFPPGNSYTLWLTRYEDTFLYPASLITAERWLAAGWGVHFHAVWKALTTNLQTLLAVQGQIVLLPFLGVGLWARRYDRIVQMGTLMWLMTFGLMTFVFPFAGTNGSFFHSGAALQPLVWASAALGFEKVMMWYARKRNLDTSERISRFVTALIIAVGVVLSIGLYINRMAGDPKVLAGWNESAAQYQRIERELVRLGAQTGQLVMVNNPPGYILASERPCVVIPFGNTDMVRAAARQFGVRYLILEMSNSSHLETLYNHPADQPGFRYLTTIGMTHLYEFTD